jgi:hypothetical protein
MKNTIILDAFRKLQVSKCNTEVGSKIIQGLQRQMHRERVKVSKNSRGRNGS